MKVCELIEELQKLDPELEVYVIQDNGSEMPLTNVHPENNGTHVLLD